MKTSWKERAVIFRTVRMVGLLLATSSLGACATIARGSQDAWEITTSPPGAAVYTSNGHYCPSTPCAIRMSRKSSFTAEIRKPGYKTAMVAVTHKTAGSGAAGMAGNVMVGGLIGIGVDLTTGATQDLTPNPVTVKLELEDYR